MAIYRKKLPRVEAELLETPRTIETDFGSQTFPAGWYLITNAYGQVSGMPADQFLAQFEEDV